MTADKKISRRTFAGALASVAASQAGAQERPRSGQRAGKNPDLELNAALERVRRRAQALQDFEVPRDTEPAFVFQV